MVAVGVDLENTGVDREAFTLNEASGHRRAHDALEDMTQDIAVAEATQPVSRQRRVVRNLVFQVEFAEPAIGEVQLDFLAQPALRTDAVAVADDEHAQRQLRIDGRPADVAVVRLKLLVEVSQRRHHEHIDATQQVVLGDATSRWNS